MRRWPKAGKRLHRGVKVARGDVRVSLGQARRRVAEKVTDGRQLDAVHPQPRRKVCRRFLPAELADTSPL
jgi:hypothetical protein